MPAPRPARRARGASLALTLALGAAACGGGGGGETTVSTTTTSGARPPQEIRVFVLNGSGISGAAATKANELRALGYQPSIGNAPEQDGTVVACVDGFEAEVKELVQVVGDNAVIGQFPVPPPAGAENVDCLVGLGR
jgi:hypothetical protein